MILIIIFTTLYIVGRNTHIVCNMMNGECSDGGDNERGSSGGVDNGGSSVEDNMSSKKWLLAHNKYRTDNPLLWDDNLASQSKNYTNTLQQTSQFNHGDKCNKNCRGSVCPGGKTCGQNLEKSTPSTSPSQSVDNWYNEKKLYNGKCDTDPQSCENSGHYTQVVWKDTKKVGCGISDNGQISACLYDIGNIIGEFNDNVQ